VHDGFLPARKIGGKRFVVSHLSENDGAAKASSFRPVKIFVLRFPVRFAPFFHGCFLMAALWMDGAGGGVCPADFGWVETAALQPG
jgi:hypothetical protein